MTYTKPSYRSLEVLDTKLADLSPEAIKSLSESAITALAKQAIIDHDYVELQYALEHASSISYSVVNEALDKLDVEAVRLIVASAKTDSDKEGNYVSSYMFTSLFDHNAFDNPELSRDDVRERTSKIISILLEAKAGKSITISDLNTLTHAASKQEFDDFCARKELDLADAKFKGLDLSKYKYEAAAPALVLSDGAEAGTMVDLLLSRTYADSFTVDKLRDMYVKLYNNSPTEMIYMSTLISQNNGIKVIFEKGASSSYSQIDNIIKVDTNFKAAKIFNIESVLRHEIGHFIYQELHSFDSQPFSIEEILKVLTKYSEGRGDRFLEECGDQFSSTYVNKLFANEQELIKAWVTRQEEYEKAAKLPIAKAAELLHNKAYGLEKYYYSQEYTEHFKFNSYIDLFFLNTYIHTEDKCGKDDGKVSDAIFRNIVSIYSQEYNLAGTCIAASREKLVQWATEEFFPKLVGELNLTPTQMHFLERIADYVNRGSHWLDDNGDSSYHSSAEEKYVELPVRGPELELVPGMEPDIIESFQGLKEFDAKYNGPYLHEAICKGNVYSLPFAEGMPNSSYACASGHDEL